MTEKFDQLADPKFHHYINDTPTGVFYSVESLPYPWKTVSQFNPFIILWMVLGMVF